MRLRVPKDLKPIYKLDEEILTPEDLRYLYVDSLDRCNIETIALIFDSDPVDVYLHLNRIKSHIRIEDGKWGTEALKRQKKNNVRHEKKVISSMYRIESEKDRLLWDEALMLYGKPRPTQTYIANGKERLDKGIQRLYFRNVRDIFIQLKSKPIVRKEVKLIRQVDLSAMRLHRGLDMYAFSKSSGLPYKAVVYYEKTSDVIIPEEISDIYFKVLNISKVEFKRILEVLSGNRKTMFQEDSRNIPDSVRDYVWQRDGGKCRTCEATKYLHMHHVTRFTDGGKHEARNLKLLCVACHAEAHFGEPGYQMLIAQAKKLGVI